METFLKENKAWPTIEEFEQRRKAFETLGKVVVGDQSRLVDLGIYPHYFITTGNSPYGVPIMITLLGTDVLDSWTAGDDMHCLCISEMTAVSFTSACKSRLRDATESKVLRIIQGPNPHASRRYTLEAEILGPGSPAIRCHIRYFTGLLAKNEHIPNFVIRPQHLGEMKDLGQFGELRDLSEFMVEIKDATVFSQACRLLFFWARRRGLLSEQLGFLSARMLVYMLVYTCVAYGTSVVGAEALVRLFFWKYSTFKWSEDMVFYTPNFSNPVPKYWRGDRPMVVLTVHEPVINLAENVTSHSLRWLSQEFALAAERLDVPSSSTFGEVFHLLTAPLELSGASWLEDLRWNIMHRFDNYVLIEFTFGRFPMNPEIFSSMEHHFHELNNRLQETVPAGSFRPFPDRFRLTSLGECHCQYYIGVDIRETSVNIPAALNEIKTVCSKYRADMPKNETWYSSFLYVWITVTQTGPNLRTKQIDHEQPRYPQGEVLLGSEEEGSRSPTQMEIASAKLRKLKTAAEVLNTIFNDHRHFDPLYYYVGFNTPNSGRRPRGEQNLAMNWLRDPSNRDYKNPERIIYVRHKDGTVVWEKTDY